MQPPEQNDGWLAQVVYLGSIALAGLVAWLTQYRRGRRDDRPNKRFAHLLPQSSEKHHVILEGAEIADMRALRSLGPELSRIGEQLQQTFSIVQDNHRIVEDNHRIVEQNREMLLILQRLQRALDVNEEVKEHERQRKIDEFLLSQVRHGPSTS